LVECIQRRERPLIQTEHAFHVLEVMLKARESSAQGRALPIESTFIAPNFQVTKTGPAHLIHDRTREHE